MSRVGDLAAAVAGGVGSVVSSAKSQLKSKQVAATGRMHVANNLGLVEQSETHLAESFRTVSQHQAAEPDIKQMTELLASWSVANEKALAPLIERYKETKEADPGSPHKALFHGPGSGGLGLLRDLHDLWLLGQEVALSYELSTQACLALRDEEMMTILKRASTRTKRQTDWLRTQTDQAAPQALTVPSRRRRIGGRNRSWAAVHPERLTKGESVSECKCQASLTIVTTPTSSPSPRAGCRGGRNCA